MTKPNIEDTRWAVTAGGVESTAILVPDGSLKDNGYADDAIPTAKNWNWIKRKAHSWFQFVDSLFTSSGALVATDPLVAVQRALTFAPFTFTADNGTDTFSKTSHGLRTGDGPVRPTAATSLPTGLLPATDYWVIHRTENVFQLATSLANALARTAVAISDNGVGALTLSTGTDASTPLVLADGTVMAPPRWVTVPALTVPTISNGAYSAGPFVLGASGVAYVPVRLAQGQVVTNFAVTEVNGGPTVELLRCKAGVDTVVGTYTIVILPPSMQEVRCTTLVGLPNFTVGAGESYFIRVTSGGSFDLESVGIYATP